MEGQFRVGELGVLDEVLDEMCFADEEKYAEDSHRVAPDFFRADGRVAIGKQGSEQRSCSIVVFQVSVKSRLWHKRTADRRSRAKGPDTVAIHPCHKGRDVRVEGRLAWWIGHGIQVVQEGSHIRQA